MTLIILCDISSRMDKEKYASVWWQNRNRWLYELARDARLKPASVRVALLFGTFLMPESREYVSPGYDWLMKHGHIKSRSTLSSSLEELRLCGYLEMDKNFHHNTTYRFPFDGEAEWKVKVQKMDSKK